MLALQADSNHDHRQYYSNNRQQTNPELVEPVLNYVTPLHNTSSAMPFQVQVQVQVYYDHVLTHRHDRDPVMYYRYTACAKSYDNTQC